MRGAHPGRALVLGGLAAGCGDVERALPLLEYALEQSEGRDDRARAARALFGAYGSAGRWQSMEALIEPRWLWDGAWPLVETALAAARAGAAEEALRLWARAVNLDRGDTRWLDRLPQAGLRKELIAFYERLGTQDPDCAYVRPILARLRKP